MAATKSKKKQEAVEPVLVRASAKYVRISPRKVRLVADQVRGKHIDDARSLLQFSPRSAADDVLKVIESAAANAEANHDLIGDEMIVHEIGVDVAILRQHPALLLQPAADAAADLRWEGPHLSTRGPATFLWR